MAFGSWLAIYVVIWWTTIFAVLPFGVRSQQEAGEVEPGSDPGAPAKARLLWYGVVNSIVAGIVFAIYRFLIWPLL